MAALSPYATHSFVAESTNNSWSNMFRFIPDGSRVLDVGCSTGNFGSALQELKGCTVVGVDINDADIEEARSRLTEAHVLDIRDEGVGDVLGRFDVVVFGDVIEHLPDPRSVLQAVHGLLTPGGAIVYSIPHMGHISVRMDLMDGRFGYTEIGLLDKTHLHFYDRQEVYSVFEDSGFVIADELPTVASYPEKWLTTRLASMGLSPLPQYFAMLASTDAHVFQYVGIALPAGEYVTEPHVIANEMMPQDEILLKSNELIVENERLEAQLRDLYARIARIRRNPLAAVAFEARRRLRRNR
ncbi:bifunctional 2-polyprenyl-6-hydroxyphenol methylase/3-demethylubiquinol 3-O-methyltransferase UbiG [Glaciihabitans sp. INWT7]|uniref:class I SAM-dependent methyltransferase n=1 Tax=Glaciihabitans sp. INWT7 TaxID=2596912 RepID=UPI001627B6F6|nr:class I SAM-dependent methyltransferase [Glaciihabitans sp. INWT7]